LIDCDPHAAELIVSANFITPYPPGYPIAIPGEILDGNRLLALTKFEHGEIHGVTSNGGRKTIQVYLLPTRSFRAASAYHSARHRLTEPSLET
jgi:arginine decarboxylase